MFLFKTINEDRYDPINFLGFSDFHDILDSAFFNNLKSLPAVGVFKIETEECRPDLLAYHIYSEEDSYKLWWLLLLYNDILLISELIAGTLIKYPSRESIEELIFNLQQREDELTEAIIREGA